MSAEAEDATPISAAARARDDPRLRAASVSAYFDLVAQYWEDVYAEPTVEGRIFQDRRVLVEAWVDRLGPPPGTRVLEVGCGAGMTTVELAGRGLQVESIDTSVEMVARTRRRLASAGLDAFAHVSHGDAQALPAADGSFSLTIAVGVIPWLDVPQRCVAELARVVEVGGHVIVTADNRARLNHILDPVLNPWLKRPKMRLRDALESIGWQRKARPRVAPRMHGRREFDALLERSGLEIIRRATVGFGPFSLLGARLPAALGIRLHRLLQRLASRGAPIVQRTGSHYVVLARRR